MAETKPTIEEPPTLQNHSTMAETKPTIEEQPTLQNHSAMAETKPTIEEQPAKAWHSYLSEDLPQSFMDSTDTAFASFRSFQDFIPEIKQKFQSYEHAAFTNLKDGLSIGAEHPAMAAGITLAATFAFFRGPRRFLFRQTVGRFQSEEARFVRAERNMKMLEISVDLMKKESRKLLERSTFAEKEMRSGLAELINVGKKMQRLAKSVNHVESQAADLMDLLREMPGREALRLRAEVASTASLLNHQKTGLVKRMSKLTEAGIPV
ncbi:RGS1-HXK1-interacting protein 1 [Silene latifolia]|uniref:RGS1-HXK1-interacting protein 1 n=1 Tax=Silene latifolia TaxID=37657 RepID=UPI003D77D8DF